MNTVLAECKALLNSIIEGEHFSDNRILETNLTFIKYRSQRIKNIYFRRKYQTMTKDIDFVNRVMYAFA